MRSSRRASEQVTGNVRQWGNVLSIAMSNHDGADVTATFGHHPWTVQELVTGVSSGQVRLPDLQRPFVWSNSKVRDLIDSMYRGYPVGELMFWENRDEAHEKAIGVGDKAQQGSMQVIDGQQRLTSLYAVLKGLPVWREDYSKERIRIAFNPISQRFDVPTPVIERSVEWISDVVTIFSDPYSTRDKYLSRLAEEGRELTAEAKKEIEIALNRVFALNQYGFQVVQVKKDVSREEVADIFVRINSEGVNLKSADFILTWMSVFWEEGRSQLEYFARDSRFTPAALSQINDEDEKVTWTPHNPYLVLTPSQLVRAVIGYALHRGRLSDAYNRLRGRDPRTREIDPAKMNAELDKLKVGQEQVLKPLHWDEFLKVLERAGFRTSEMVTSDNTVLYSYVLWLIGRVEHGVGIDDLREMMARWFFVSQLTGRYTNSPESQIQDDLARLEAIQGSDSNAFIAAFEEMLAAAAPPDWWSVTLPDNLFTSSTISPSFVGYIASLNILDADVLLSNLKVKDWINPARKPKKGVEKHHLFPKSYLKNKMKITSTKQINQIANYALVEWSDNIDISDDEPSKYWPEQIKAKNIKNDRLASQLAWHALPEGWTSMEFDDFLKARRILMARVIQEGYKRLTDPSYQPDLARLDFGGEEAEASLATLEELVGAGLLPPGTLLSPAEADTGTIAQITEEGKIEMNERQYSSPTAAARDDGADISDGWRYWVAHLDSAEVLIDDLRNLPTPTT